MSKWQDISTAPRDGTWILVAGGNTTDDEVDRNIAVAQFTYYLNGKIYPDKGKWQFAWYDGGYYGTYNNPTHWMPLPDAPA